MVKVLICEDQTLVRQGLVALLESEPGITIVGEAVNGREGVEKTGALRPDVVLMDVRMPIMDGIEATRLIAERYPSARVIMLTTYEGGDVVFEGVKAGAMGYLLKDASLAELLSGIRRVHEGECLIQSAVASSILFELARGRPRPAADPAYEPLTEREIAIVSRLANGMSNREIAHALGLAEGTIKNNVSIILSKLHAANRVQAVKVARDQKLI